MKMNESDQQIFSSHIIHPPKIFRILYIIPILGLAAICISMYSWIVSTRSDMHPFVSTCRKVTHYSVACEETNYTTSSGLETIPEVKQMLIAAQRTSSDARKLHLLELASKHQPFCGDVYAKLGEYHEKHGNTDAAWSNFLHGALQNNSVANTHVSKLLPKFDEQINKLADDLDNKGTLWQQSYDTLSDDQRVKEHQQARALYVQNTNGIEGNNLTIHQVNHLLDSASEIRDRVTLHEIAETFGTADAFDYIWQTSNQSNYRVTVDFIKTIHRYLMQSIEPSHAGNFRSFQVYVNGRKPPPSHQIASLLDKMIYTWSSPKFRQLHPLVQAVTVHTEFAWLHPFHDGNGRTARFLATSILRARGYPVCDIDSVYREEYYAAVTAAMPSEGANMLPLMRIYGGCMEQAIQRAVSFSKSE